MQTYSTDSGTIVNPTPPNDGCNNDKDNNMRINRVNINTTSTPSLYDRLFSGTSRSVSRMHHALFIQSTQPRAWFPVRTNYAHRFLSVSCLPMNIVDVR